MNAETTKEGASSAAARVKGNVDLSVVGDGYPRLGRAGGDAEARRASTPTASSLVHRTGLFPTVNTNPIRCSRMIVRGVDRWVYLADRIDQLEDMLSGDGKQFVKLHYAAARGWYLLNADFVLDVRDGKIVEEQVNGGGGDWCCARESDQQVLVLLKAAGWQGPRKAGRGREHAADRAAAPPRGPRPATPAAASMSRPTPIQK